jgi:two-component system LytT family response regulator
VTIRTLIADDELPARLRLRRLLAQDEDIEVIAECSDGESAVEAIRRVKPDLVLLDVQMPEMDGFEVMDAVGVERMPVTIFVTAHGSYALRAFDVRALDYLVKPFGKARFATALGRAKEQIAGRANRDAERYPERLPVPHRGRVVFVNTVEIEWVEALGNYSRLHTGYGCFELRGTLASVERKLDPAEFLRIHRSTIVNIRSIKEIHKWFRGHHVVILNCGKELRMSRYQRDVAKRLGVSYA